MAAAVACANAWAQLKESSSRRNGNGCRKGFRVSCVSSPVTDPYKTLQIRPTASESEIKKAFRKLALKYHPDVCRGSNCGVEFQQINEAYDSVLKALRGEPSGPEVYEYCAEDELWDWDEWEWMGWEAAGVPPDYPSDINHYV